jgi:hypothetical protein
MIDEEGNMKILDQVYIVLTFLMLLPTLGFSQIEDYAQNQDLQYLEIGQRQMDAGDYEAADESFKLVLETVDVLPAEICYFFGANSYHLKKYKQSINWLNKYMELKGTSGQYFEECTEYLEKSEQAYRDLQEKRASLESETSAAGTEVDYSTLPEIDCGPTGKVICPVCKGRTVIIKSGRFRREYQTCPYCDDHGNLTCDEYNLLLKGELQPKEGRLVE